MHAGGTVTGTPGPQAAPVDVKPVMSQLPTSNADSGADDDSHGRGKRKRKVVDISDMLDEEHPASADGDWRDSDAERSVLAAAIAAAQPPQKMANTGVLLRRCALCRCGPGVARVYTCSAQPVSNKTEPLSMVKHTVKSISSRAVVIGMRVKFLPVPSTSLLEASP